MPQFALSAHERRRRHAVGRAVAATGAAIVLLHGLTATRRYVVMGSRALRALRPPRDRLRRPRPRPLDAGAAARRLRLRAARRRPRRGARRRRRRARAARGRVDGRAHGRALRARAPRAGGRAGARSRPRSTPRAPRATRRASPDWDALARGLREGGVEGFVRRLRPAGTCPSRLRATVADRAAPAPAAHEHPHAVADALEVVPRSRPFEQLGSSSPTIAVPTVVVASRDEADPGHPLAVGERYAAHDPRREARGRGRRGGRAPSARRSPGRAGSSRG